MLWWVIILLRMKNGGNQVSSSNPVVPMPVVIVVIAALIGAGIYCVTMLDSRRALTHVAGEGPAARNSAPGMGYSPEPTRHVAVRDPALFDAPVIHPNKMTVSIPVPPDVEGAATIVPIAASAIPAPASAIPAPPDAAATDAVPVAAVVPAAPPAVIPENPTPDSVADAAARLAIPDWSTRYHSVAWLSKQHPTADDRALAVPALITALDDEKEVTRTAAALTLETWADASSEAAIIAKLPASAGETRKVLLSLCTKVKTPGLADAVAALMADAPSRVAARRALADMGPVAEKAALDLLKSEDAALRRDACFILQNVGTKASLAALKPHTKVVEKDAGVQSAAGMAIDSINLRNK